MDDRWPYPVSQAMQRHTGIRVKLLPLAGTPPIAPDTAKIGDVIDPKTEPSRAGKVEQHSTD